MKALHDSRKVRKGYIFALRGQKTNGEKYIEAVQRGASVIICSKNCDYKNNVTIYKSPNVRNLLIKLPQIF